MTHPQWVKQHILLLLSLLIILILANLWLFVPQFIKNQQLLTASELKQQDLALQQTALQGAKLLSQSTNPTQTATQLQALQTQADDAIVLLQHAQHHLNLNSSVHQSLSLAQIISFTLHDVSFDVTDSLKTAQTAQVLNQAATNAQTLANQIPTDQP